MMPYSCRLVALSLHLITLMASVSVGQAEIRQVKQWHPLEVAFNGPATCEQAADNPFTNYRLLVEFKGQSGQAADQSVLVRGFYAADGNAAETSADAGNVWKVVFAPDLVGKWTYHAKLSYGRDIALDPNPSTGTPVPLRVADGSFEVLPAVSDESTPAVRDFRQRGRIVVEGHHFRFANQGPYWLKGGTDSPENLLAYEDFDGTFRVSAEASDGEAQASEELHRYQPHVGDWRSGDPVWQGGRGKGLIGGINYLASQGMNSAYFLTMNIGGDGKDVWPFVQPDNFERFDCSKLDQWEIVFRHMQRQGLLMHVVTQETENETLFDGGDTGRIRQLYLLELIARFAHHPALVWNLGEENGPAHWTPVGQTTAQRQAMAAFVKRRDPYGHPVVIHSHATPQSKDELLTGMLGNPHLDGIGFQVAERKQVHSEIIRWHRLSSQAGKQWLIGMDEIGQWHTGVKPDADDPQHDTIRRYVLWGGLMAGAAGVEWYFGAKYPSNDLTCDDWRTRARLWQLTRQALDFFRQIPYWEMRPEQKLLKNSEGYCLAQLGKTYAIYLPDTDDKARVALDLTEAGGQFRCQWFDPLQGGPLQSGARTQLSGGRVQELGQPPHHPEQDWVVLVRQQ